MSNGTLYTNNICDLVASNGVSTLLGIYAQATVKELRDGLAWYATALDEAKVIADTYSLPVLTVVQVACALSPRLRWENNMLEAEKVIRFHASGGTFPSIALYESGAMKLQRTKDTPENAKVLSDFVQLPWSMSATRVNVLKALWILQGHVWVLRGSKVSSFCDNILNHLTSTAVTVDSHAIQAWFGRMETGTYSVTEKYYRIIEADYRTASRVVGCSPLQFQAVVWVVKKRITAQVNKAIAKAKKDGIVWTIEDLSQAEQDAIASGETTFEHAQRRAYLAKLV
jgi:hypothetical protein